MSELSFELPVELGLDSEIQPGFGQAQAFIYGQFFQYAQAQTDIKAISKVFAQAQAKINAFGVNGFAQAQARIITRYTALILSDTPAVYYKLNESSGTVIADEVRPAHDGTANGSPTFGTAHTIPVEPGNTGITFSGASGQYISGSVPAIAGSSVISVEFWMKWDGTHTSFGMPFGLTTFDLAFNGSNFGFNTGAGDHRFISSTGMSGVWKHVVAIMTPTAQSAPSGIKLYIDSVLQTLSGSNTNNITITSSFRLSGWVNGNGQEYGGVLDEFAIFNYELTAGQVLAHYLAGLPTNGYAQAQAKINAFAVKGYGQALAYIGHFQWAQAQTDIKATDNKFGQAQAKLRTFGVQRYGQAQAFIRKSAGYANANADILAISNGFAQAGALLNTGFGLAQAQAKINAFDYPQFAQAAAQIIQIPYYISSGTSAVSSSNITPGLPAGTQIDDVLLLFLENRNSESAPSAPSGWASVLNSPSGGGNTGHRLTVFWKRVVGGEVAPTITYSGDHILGIIVAYRNCIPDGDPWDVTTAGATGKVADTTFSATGTQTTVPTLVIIAASRQLSASIGSQYTSFANSGLVDIAERADIGSTIGEDEALGVADGKSRIVQNYGTTTVTVSGSVAGGTNNAWMTIALKYGFRASQGGQAQAQILVTKNTFAQTQTSITPYYLVDDIANSLTITDVEGFFSQDIDAFTADTTTSDPIAIPTFRSGWIKIDVTESSVFTFDTLGSYIDTVIAIYDSSLTFISSDDNRGQYYGDVMGYEAGLGSTSVLVPITLLVGTYYLEVSTITFDEPLTHLLHFHWILEPTAGFGQALATIRTTAYAFAQAQVVITLHWALGQAQAQIKSFNNRGFGQAQALIRANYVSGQANADIKATINRFGQTQADILVRDNCAFGQAQMRLIYLGTQIAQAQACVRGNAWAQAQADIKQTYQKYAQATQRIKRTERSYGQAQGNIANRKYPHGQAAATVIRVEPPPPAPTGRDFGPPEYIVMFGDFQLAGYAQSEDITSDAQLDDFYAFGWNEGSITQFSNLLNFTLSMDFLIFDADGWASAKEQFLAIRAQLLSAKDQYRQLHIGTHEGAYLAKVKSVSYAKSVPQNMKMLRYTVEFACQPWLISGVTRTLSTVFSDRAANTITTDEVGRTIDNGTWTPTVVNLTGLNVTVSGYTDTEFTGYISVSGYVSGMILDSEAATTLLQGENAENYMYVKDHILYVGVGKTTFDITGADNITISYKDRW